MEIDVLSIFPGLLEGPLNYSILARARDKGILRVNLLDIRAYAKDRHRKVDDYPYGGGAGMVMKPEPIFAAVEEIRGRRAGVCGPVLLMSPRGEVFTQKKAWELARQRHLVLICGRYEGVDERVREHLVEGEISIGDYILTGGELPALVVIDAVARLLPGVLGGEDGLREESFAGGLLEYPQYTRPADFRGLKVPEVLVSGNHAEVRRWRRREALRLTLLKRPDLLRRVELTREDEEWLAAVAREKEAKGLDNPAES